MLYTAQQIAQVLSPETELKPSKYTEAKLKYILTDSRRLREAALSVFFALKTERNDGSKYIADLYKKGVRVFVVQKDYPEFNKFSEAIYIAVEDTLKALQTIVKHHRQQFDIPIIGITGSNGKTILKEWIFELLKKDKKVVRTPRSYNSQIGVPLSVWMLDETTDVGVFEAGISKDGEMSRLERIIQPNIGIFSNIGDAHQENFIDYRHKISEKIKLFTNCNTIIYCKDNQLIDLQFSDSKMFEDKNLLTWSEKFSADLRVTDKKQASSKTIITALYNGEELSFSIPFVDAASYENMMHICLLLLHMGYKLEDVQNRISNLSHIAMRLEQKQAVNDCTIINDSYNSDIGSLNIALDFLSQQYQHQKRTLILSDILQSGRNASVLYKDVADLLKQKTVNRFIGIGEGISSMANLFDENSSFYPTTDVFLEDLSLDDFQNEAILIKGARKFEFERISNFLQNKNHETILEVNLSNLIYNLNYFRSKLKPKVKLMAMVKAFSYGAGSVEVSNVLQFHNVDYLAVAYADEGVALRKAGIALPIMVMNPEEMSMDLMIRYRLEPEIYSFRTLMAYYEAIRESGTVYGPMHIKIETGMNRLGFVEKDIPELIQFVQSNPTLKIASVFSHLAGSDDVQFDGFTQQQIAIFSKISERVCKAFPYHIIRHISNSNGIIRHPNAQFDMVRLGIGMYGVSTEASSSLKEVNSLHTRLSQVKEVSSSDTIGYNRSGKLLEGGKIGIVPIGYADGIRRSLGNGKGQFWINGKLAPVVGNVCMDMCMLDLTGIDAKEGDLVEVFGSNYSIEHIAKQMDTIAYEVLTGISQRVKRIYYQE
jgi:alanine racemase